MLGKIIAQIVIGVGIDLVKEKILPKVAKKAKEKLKEFKTEKEAEEAEEPEVVDKFYTASFE